MQFIGRVWRDGAFWLSELALADVMTQGRTRRSAIAMLGDAVEALVNRPAFRVAVADLGGEDLLVSATVPEALISLALKRQRERHGLSLAEVARALNQASRNGYARYERGTSVPTIAKLDALFGAVAPGMPVVMGMHARTLPAHPRPAQRTRGSRPRS